MRLVGLVPLGGAARRCREVEVAAVIRDVSARHDVPLGQARARAHVERLGRERPVVGDGALEAVKPRAAEKHLAEMQPERRAWYEKPSSR